MSGETATDVWTEQTARAGAREINGGADRSEVYADVCNAPRAQRGYQWWIVVSDRKTGNSLHYFDRPSHYRAWKESRR